MDHVVHCCFFSVTTNKRYGLNAYVFLFFSGSRKLDNACTSAIQISVELSGTVSVAFYKHHHGHGKGLADLVHVPLPRADREWIAGMFSRGFHRFSNPRRLSVVRAPPPPMAFKA